MEKSPAAVAEKRKEDYDDVFKMSPETGDCVCISNK